MLSNGCVVPTPSFQSSLSLQTPIYLPKEASPHSLSSCSRFDCCLTRGNAWDSLP